MYTQTILLLLPIIVGVIANPGTNQDDLTANCDGTKSDCVSSTKQNLACANEETKLFKDLFSGYGEAERFTRGVKHHGDTMKTTFGLKILSVADMDTTNGVATINAWTIMDWSDNRLMWDPSKYGDLKNLRVPSDAVWRPDMVLYNSAKANVESQEAVNVLVYSNGHVLWVPLYTIKLPCRASSTDEQAWTCDLKYGSWTYDGNQVDIDFFEGKKEVDLDFFTELDNGYTVKSMECEKHTKHYPGIEDPYQDLTFRIKIAKK